MNFDSHFFGSQALTASERDSEPSSYRAIREALFRNRYYLVWGAPGEPPLPTYEVTLWRTLRGFLKKRMWHFQDAANRTVDSQADMRWGADGKGFRRLLHPNGVCLFGTWKINADSPRADLTGYFAPGKQGLVVARYSTCCTETRRGRWRSLAMVGNIYPTLDEDVAVRPVSFITQQDFGGEKTEYLDEAFLRTNPSTTPWRRGWGLPVLLLTGFVLFRSDKRPTARQVYPIAELEADGKPVAPEFMRLKPSAGQPRIGGVDLDFRDEVLSQIYDPGDPNPRREWKFDIEAGEHGGKFGVGLQWQWVHEWKPIGSIVFKEAVASYNADFVFHARHAPWRNNHNDPGTVARTRRPLF